MWGEGAFRALQVIQRYAQNHGLAHHIKPDRNATHGGPFDKHTPNRDVAWYFHDLAYLGKRRTLHRISRGRKTPQSLDLFVRDGQLLSATRKHLNYAGNPQDLQICFSQGAAE